MFNTVSLRVLFLFQMDAVQLNKKMSQTFIEFFFEHKLSTYFKTNKNCSVDDNLMKYIIILFTP